MSVSNRFLVRTVAMVCLAGVSSGCGGGGGSSPIPPAPIPSNAPPTVNAGSDQSVNEADRVVLEGVVVDPDSTPTVSWTQTAGPNVRLDGADQAQARFTAPDVEADQVLSFRLTAQDGVNPAVSDSVDVTVRDIGVVVVRVSPPGTSYIDHELHPDESEMVFLSNGAVWTGALDPDTGLFASADGLDQRIDAQATPLDVARNGPEYGIDHDGVAIYYNRTASDGAVEVWRAASDGAAGYVVSRISPLGNDRINPLPSRSPNADAVSVAYARIETSAAPDVIGTLTVVNEDTEVETDLTPARVGFAGFRWIDGGEIVAFTLADGPDEGQVGLFDARLGTTRVVTNDSGVKFDPYPWRAPELADALAFTSIINGRDIAVYRDGGGAQFDRIATLSPPPESGLDFIQSPEPFIYQDRSWIILTLKDNPGGIATDVTDSQIWIYSIEADPEGFPLIRLRCDDGAGNRVRSEGEVALAPDGGLRVYYNELEPSGRFSIVLCRAGFALAAQ